ncbi:MAG TPA: ribbon-helix-helix protein, CopG family [Thermomicrobiales bacterium]|nr:ribbon-helix-helix protein, CopG family [Thermomicrobiales bacterium]
MTTSVRIDRELHDRLRKIADSEHRSMGQVLDDAVRQYERERFWQGVQSDFARLRANPDAWRSYQDEISSWDATAGDGLEDEEPYYTPEEEDEINAEYARTYGRGRLGSGSGSEGRS